MKAPKRTYHLKNGGKLVIFNDRTCRGYPAWSWQAWFDQSRTDAANLLRAAREFGVMVRVVRS